MNYKIPEMLYIETTNTCNANCIFCAYQYDTRPKHIIDTNLFQKISKRYREVGGEKVSLSPFAGEIFTDPDILNKINYLQSLNFKTIYSYTNGLLFHKFNIKEILNSGLTSLNISMAPLDKETYIKIYRNKNYKQLLINISTFLDEFNQTSKKTLQSVSLEFRSNMSLQQIQGLDDYKKYIQPYITDKTKISSMDTFDSWMGVIHDDDLLKGMKIKNHNFPKTKPCMRLNMLQVLSNGDTRICGCRYNNKSNYDIFNIGNANNEDIIKMYNKKSVEDIKQSFYTNNIPKECALCSWYEEVKK